MELKLVRLTKKDSLLATRGVLLIGIEPEIVTLEPPWRDNRQNISCIPAGDYVAKRTLARTTTGGLFIPETFEVSPVNHRGGILFHIGNSVKDTNGCILLGASFGYLDEVPAILQSKIGFARFLAVAKGHSQVDFSIRWG